MEHKTLETEGGFVAERGNSQYSESSSRNEVMEGEAEESDRQSEQSDNDDDNEQVQLNLDRYFRKGDKRHL